MPRTTLAIVACLALVGSVAVAQSCPAGTTTLLTNLISNNGQSGVMFDVTASTTLTICTFNVNFVAGSQTIAVYSLPPITDTGASYYQPNHNVAAPWTLDATVTVTSNGTNMATLLPMALNHTLTAGQRKAYYITATVGTGQNYINGTAHNVVWATDGNLTVYTGAGKPLPLFTGGIFGGTATASRNFSGSICYVLGAGGCPSGPYDTNTPGANLDINGLQGTAFAPALSVICPGAPVTVTISTNNPGQAFELGYNLAALVPIGGGGTPIGPNAKLNLDLSAGINFLNGGAVPLFLPNPGSIVLQFAMPVIPAPGLSAQVMQINPAHPDGFELSQPVNLQSATPAPVAGPTGDDSAVTINLGGAPLCGPASIVFCGVTYTRMHVISNGRVMFGASADTDFSPTIAEGLADQPWVGYWADFEPNVQGTITISSTPTTINVDYVNVRYWQEPTPPNAATFQIRFDATNNSVILDGLLGINPDPNPTAGSVNQALMGIFCGPGSTDPGATTFTNPGTGCATLATDALYDFEAGTAATGPYRVPSLNAGTLNRITFNPQSGGGYCWTGS